MRSRTLGWMAAIALLVGAVLLGLALVWGQPRDERETPSATPLPTEESEETPPLPPTASPVASQPMTYTVRQGDTLSAIAQAHGVSLETLIAANDLANPNFLQIGEVLIIPEEDAPEPPNLTSTVPPIDDSSAGGSDSIQVPTLTPSGPSLVEISEVRGVGGLETEVIVLGNHGGTVSLEDWTLSSGTGDTFTFPSLTVFPEADVRVYSASGGDTPRDLYWGRSEPAWREGALITLRDAQGNVVDTYVVPEP